MAAGRKTRTVEPTTDVTIYPAQTPESMAQAERDANIAADAMLASQLVMRAIGRVEAYSIVAKIGDVSALLELQHIKESKAYRGLPFNASEKTGEVRQFCNTWDDFCEHFLHEPRKTVDDRLLMLSTFGEQVLEGKRRLGLSDRALRQLRLVPDSDDKDEVIERIKAAEGDAEEIREVIEQLVEKKESAIKKLTSERNAFEKDYETEKVLAARYKQEANRLPEELPWDEAIKPLTDEVGDVVAQLMEQAQKLRVRLAQVGEHIATNPPTTEQAQVVGRAVIDLVEGAYLLLGEVRQAALEEHAKAAGPEYVNLLA